MIQNAREALDYLPAEDLAWRSTAVVALGDAHSLKGEVVNAYQAYSEALEASQASGNTYMVPVVSIKLAITSRAMGQLNRTIKICQQQLQVAGEHAMSHTVVAGCLLAIWGEVLAERNDLAGAIEKTRNGAALTDRGGDVAMLGWANMCLVRVLFSQGDLDQAEAIIQKLMEADRELDMPVWLMVQLSTWQVRIWLAQGKLEPASRWAEQHERDTDGWPIFQLEVERIVYARILHRQERLDEATELLHSLRTAATTGERTSRVIEITLLQALVYQAAGDMEQAMEALEHALTITEPGGFVRVFIDEGPPVARLLYEAAARDIAPTYARRLLAAFPTTEIEHPTAPNAPTAGDKLIEPLSERELDVLELIAEGLTNQEVANRLFLSLNTVKVHARNIYDKLSVHNRTQAVTRSRALGILPPV